MDDPGYFVEVGDVLTNKLGISDSEQLANIEYDITAKKSQEVIKGFRPTKLDFQCLLDVHKHLFEDIYDFSLDLM